VLKNSIDDASHSRGESRAVRAVVRREKEKGRERERERESD